MDINRKNKINDRIVSNIQCLCKIKNIKIGELEKRIGVRIGYFSRKKKQHSAVGLYELLETAEILGVSLDGIINDNTRVYILNTELEEIEKRKQEIIDEMNGLTKP